MGGRGGLPLVPEHRPLPVPQGLNERRAASDSLQKLQEEVAKLWMEILVSKGECGSGARGGTVTVVCWRHT